VISHQEWLRDQREGLLPRTVRHADVRAIW
jgi:hypothetical protein